ncbi:MAG TPA: DDE-type integrase/transposase/recombinase, partial [Actinomycetota bacterium]
GPTLSPDEVRSMTAAILAAAAGVSWDAASGSLPPVVSNTFYSELIMHLAPTGTRIALDTSSPRVVGFSMAKHMRAELVCDALGVAIEHRRRRLHSDRGCQYTLEDFASLCAAHGITQSTSRSGNAWDNTGHAVSHGRKISSTPPR